MLISITASSIKTIENDPNQATFEMMGNEVKRCPHCCVPFVSSGGCPTMWCPRCRKKFCQLCLEPAIFIPVPIHLAFGQCKSKESKSWQLRIILLFLCVFMCFNYMKVSYWYLVTLFVSLFINYFVHLFTDWVDSLSWGKRLFGRCMLMFPVIGITLALLPKLSVKLFMS